METKVCVICKTEKKIDSLYNNDIKNVSHVIY